MSIALLIRRMGRLKRHQRIVLLKFMIRDLPARSIRRQELEHLLRDEMVAQLKAENRAA